MRTEKSTCLNTTCLRYSNGFHRHRSPHPYGVGIFCCRPTCAHEAWRIVLTHSHQAHTWRTTHATYSRPHTHRTHSHSHAHTRARIYARPLVHARSHLRMTCDACTHVACTCAHIRVRSCARPLIRVAITGLPSKTREVFQILQGWPGAFGERKQRLGAQPFSWMRVWMPNRAWLLRPVLEASGDVWAIV